MNTYNFKTDHLKGYDNNLIDVHGFDKNTIMENIFSLLKKQHRVEPIISYAYKMKHGHLKVYKSDKLVILDIETFTGSSVFAYAGEELINITKQLKDRFYM